MLLADKYKSEARCGGAWPRCCPLRNRGAPLPDWHIAKNGPPNPASYAAVPPPKCVPEHSQDSRQRALRVRRVHPGRPDFRPFPKQPLRRANTAATNIVQLPDRVASSGPRGRGRKLNLTGVGAEVEGQDRECVLRLLCRLDAPTAARQMPRTLCRCTSAGVGENWLARAGGHWSPFPGPPPPWLP